jgi:hypothetical protein
MNLNKLTSHFPFPEHILFKFSGHWLHFVPKKPGMQHISNFSMQSSLCNEFLILSCLFLNQSNK